ncbi:Acg family FMN-binding oxidoreductase [Haloarcula salinisoli]|uniref:Nitroreductase family protein n=1 Tax=Haloarcula salinisoli TaxID=2487746 RepID=A0A8J8CCZ2_9EURY|nr:nitroreductase family protein [Halomicroarcula salinisoli]MBX0286833.1 nitroreductase family protein [Halomicroarcula salinisoli]MBX0304135.1 nitroreductase family protein [Halomicroarcula salinisoli]
MQATSLTRSVWEIDADAFPTDGPIEDQATFVLRYAILAPSSHNAQPWAFDVDGNEITIAAEESRWLEAADPDKRELYISLGCAVENCCVAAEQFGFDPEVEYHDPASADVVTVTLEADEPADPRPADLFDALTTRATSHELFDGRPLEDTARERLEAVETATGVTLQVVEDPVLKTAVAELQAEADRRQMDDPAYRRDLGHWVGIGALGSSWLLARIGQAVLTHLDVGDREAAKNSKLVQSAPAIGVLSTDSDGPVAQVRTGQAFERIALLADSEGVAVHPMSQTLERQALRTQLGDLLDTPGVPQHLFRLGYADEAAEHTPRWPLETVLADRVV